MRVATYNRKSVYSDHSDSVANQERMCRDYARLKFGNEVESFDVYQDEGYTGANTNRPGLTKLLTDINSGKIDALVVYQLDRLSRSVKDFAEIFDKITKHEITFISIKENMDVDTPIGRAMINIAMVFAQMERETIAERVSDNARGLAMKGLWPAGHPPMGYDVESILVDGKKHFRLVEDTENSEFVRGLYGDCLETGKSSHALAILYRNRGWKTPKGTFYQQSQIHKILTNPIYCGATADVYDYWKGLGVTLVGPGRECWDGTKGVMVYGRFERGRNAKRETIRPKSEWMVSLGQHSPLIPGEDWLRVQAQFQDNPFDKESRNPPPLLKGIVRCGSCGCLMSVVRKEIKSGVLIHYACRTRRYRGKETCSMTYLRADEAEKKIKDILHKAIIDKDVLDSFYAASSAGTSADEETIRNNEKTAKTLEAKLDNLSAALAEAGDSVARKYIIAEIGKTDAELCRIQESIEKGKKVLRTKNELEANKEKNRLTIENFLSRFDEMSTDEKNRILKGLFKSCVWDGSKLVITMA